MMKKPILLIFTLALSASAANAAEIQGTFSAARGEMKCTGPWSHPFVPLGGRLNWGVPQGGAMVEGDARKLIVRREGVFLRLEYIDSRGRSNVGLLPSVRVKMKETDQSISLSQKRFSQSNWDYGVYLGTTFNQRFKAELSLDEAGNLVLDNYWASGAASLKKGNHCVLPRLQ